MSSSTMRDVDRQSGKSDDLLARQVRALESISTPLRLVAIAAIGVIFGVFGIILATPVTAAVIAAVQALEGENPDY